MMQIPWVEKARVSFQLCFFFHSCCKSVCWVDGLNATRCYRIIWTHKSINPQKFFLGVVLLGSNTSMQKRAEVCLCVLRGELKTPTEQTHTASEGFEKHHRQAVCIYTKACVHFAARWVCVWERVRGRLMFNKTLWWQCMTEKSVFVFIVYKRWCVLFHQTARFRMVRLLSRNFPYSGCVYIRSNFYEVYDGVLIHYS